MYGVRRKLHTAFHAAHKNPLSLPRSRATDPPQLPHRGHRLPQKRYIPQARCVVAVASGKGGVGKSTIAVNLALALSTTRATARVGLLDLDVFGPSIPKLMGLEGVGEPDLTAANALVPLTNYNIPCMSMGFLLQPSAAADAPVVWRGLMVQKAVQQLLFDVDWCQRTGQTGQAEGGLDVLVIDMPPGTGDVQLTLGQLVHVDGAVIVSTPQDVALLDARKSVHMFRKVDIPVLGLLINSAYYRCPSCTEKRYLFGPLDGARRTARELDLGGGVILGEIPLVDAVSELGDKGRLGDMFAGSAPRALSEVRTAMEGVAERVWEALSGGGSNKK